MPRKMKNKSLNDLTPATPSAQLLAEKPKTPATQNTPTASTKKKTLFDDESDDDNAEFVSAQQSPEKPELVLKVNEEYAKRFEHNKKREELHRLEEKYGKDIKINPKKRAREDTDAESEDDDDDSSSEDEDDIAILATETIDQQIQNTIAKIRAKDPAIYDGKTPFYDPIEATEPAPEKGEKPMFLRDYHRENLLSGRTGGEDSDSEENAPKTFAQQQEDLKRTVVKEMHAAAEAEADGSDDDDFIIQKSKPEKAEKSEKTPATSDLPDPKTADPNNPDDYLQKFLASRAWTKNSAGYVPIESDDSDSDAAADDFEYNFNMRFEDPNAAERAKLATYARGTVAEQTVRREEKSRRKKAREEKRKRKEEQKAREEEEKRRLRKLKTEEMMEKVKKIKEAAGLTDLDEEQELEMFHKLMEKDFSDEEWEKWMMERFNDDYYGQEDPMKKPEFDDDIDINDIVPDFSGDEAAEEDDNNAEAPAEEDDEEMPDADESDEDLAKKPKSKKKTKKDILREKAEKKAKDRSLRRKLERFVEDNFDVDAEVGTKKATFRYRETTPETFGLSPLDILAAPDAELNKFAGLKKYAAFRDKEKKERDRKQLAKKKRVKQWRYETFGDGEGVKMPEGWKPEGLVEKREKGEEKKESVAGEVDIKEGEKKKRRKKKSKTSKA